jgi:ketosteroid isomerase-like protein
MLMSLSPGRGGQRLVRGDTILTITRLLRGETRACSGLTRCEHSSGGNRRAETMEVPTTEEPAMDKSGRHAEIERLERAFWQSLVERDADVATGLLADQALMVSSHGTTRFDPAQYTKMLQDPKHGLLEYTLSDMDVLFPSDDLAIATYRARQKMEMDGRQLEQDVVDSSTWVKVDGAWKCAAHTETQATPPM